MPAGTTVTVPVPSQAGDQEAALTLSFVDAVTNAQFTASAAPGGGVNVAIVPGAVRRGVQIDSISAEVSGAGSFVSTGNSPATDPTISFGGLLTGEICEEPSIFTATIDYDVSIESLIVNDPSAPLTLDTLTTLTFANLFAGLPELDRPYLTLDLEQHAITFLPSSGFSPVSMSVGTDDPTATISLAITDVPEPGMVVLFGCGMATVYGCRRRRHRNRDVRHQTPAVALIGGL